MRVSLKITALRSSLVFLHLKQRLVFTECVLNLGLNDFCVGRLLRLVNSSLFYARISESQPKLTTDVRHGTCPSTAGNMRSAECNFNVSSRSVILWIQVCLHLVLKFWEIQNKSGLPCFDFFYFPPLKKMIFQFEAISIVNALSWSLIVLALFLFRHAHRYTDILFSGQ